MKQYCCLMPILLVAAVLGLARIRRWHYARRQTRAALDGCPEVIASVTGEDGRALVGLARLDTASGTVMVSLVPGKPNHHSTGEKRYV
jgi:H+/Cl- antiporter ClcA